MDMKLGPKIRHVRKLRGLSQTKVGVLVGVHQTQVGKWEKGTNTPDIQQAKSLADVLNVPLDYLVDDQVDDPPAPEITPDERALLKALRKARIDPADLLGELLRRGTPVAVEDAHDPGKTDREARRGA